MQELSNRSRKNRSRSRSRENDKRRSRRKHPHACGCVCNSNPEGRIQIAIAENDWILCQCRRCVDRGGKLQRCTNWVHPVILVLRISADLPNAYCQECDPIELGTRLDRAVVVRYRCRTQDGACVCPRNSVAIAEQTSEPRPTSTET